MPGTGKQYDDLLHAYTNLALFGFMVKDTSTGFDRPGLGEVPLIYYNLNRDEMQRLIKAMNILCEVFFAAGAQYLMMPTLDDPFVKSKDDMQRIRDRQWKPRDLLLSAYHPLGTARIGHTNHDSAINTNYECHNVPGLFVVDGSSVPGSLGVNPQLTIMAMATQAANKISQLLHWEETHGSTGFLSAETGIYYYSGN
ncbi:MAG: hypothetical protein JW920_12275 [Deltaproteobacteria bacterium]|nr:hypothetical protein [Deltaproteobacteria bacterium]